MVYNFFSWGYNPDPVKKWKEGKGRQGGNSPYQSNMRGEERPGINCPLYKFLGTPLVKIINILKVDSYEICGKH